MNVLVTGATGFLGFHLAEKLKQEGYHVTATGRNRKIANELRKKGISFLACDLTDEEKTIALCKNQDFIFHTAALSSPWGKYEEFYQANVKTTKNIIQGCKTYHPKRLIHVSTPSIYFNHDERIGVKEDDTLPPVFVNHYAHTKWLAEQEIDQAFAEGISTVTIRPRALFGPRDTTIIPRLIRANEKGALPLFGDGKTLMDITYVGNVVDALLLCMHSPECTLGQKYNITNGDPVYLIDMLQLLFSKLDLPFQPKYMSFSSAYRLAYVMEGFHRIFRIQKEPLLTRYTVGVLGKSQTLNITKAKNELGYKPSVSVKEGLDLFVKWREEQHEHGDI